MCKNIHWLVSNRWYERVTYGNDKIEIQERYEAHQYIPHREEDRQDKHRQVYPNKRQDWSGVVTNDTEEKQSILQVILLLGN